MKIAIIGGGIAGIAAAHKLHHSHQVTIFEVAPMLGGHAHGVEVEPGVFADTGVIIYNQGSYPEFIALLKELGTYDSNFRMEMSISFNNIRFKRAMALGKKPFLLAGKLSQLIHPRNLRIFFELWKFYKNGKTYLKEVQGSGIRLETFMNGKKYSPFFLEEFLFPLAMAIWSLPRGYFRNIEAELFLKFLDHHRCLGGDLTNFRWYTFNGSTRSYIEKFAATFQGEICLNTIVTSVENSDKGAVLRLKGEEAPRVFDHVIIATHADTALKLLASPTVEEKKALGAWTYHSTKVYLHQDESFAPPLNLRSSWNIFYGDRPSDEWITYDINRIQKLKSSRPYFVTLSNEGRPQHILKEIEYSHPVFDHQTSLKFEALEALNQVGNRSFCGSYFGYGFHEDAIRSANKVASKLMKK